MHGAKRVLVLLLPVTVAIIACVAVGLQVLNIIGVHVDGKVNVPSPAIIDQRVEVAVEEESGTRVLELGVVDVPRDGLIKVKGELLGHSGDFSLVLSGTLDLVSESKSYRIAMPCLVAIKEPCYRIMAIIPGYDEPMQIEQGRYNVTLTLEWARAGGRGYFSLRILGVYSDREAI